MVAATLNGVSGRLDVGRLRVVDEPHSRHLADRLQGMREPGEPVHGPGHVAGRHANQIRDGAGRQHVSQQMPARQMHRRQRYERLVAGRAPTHDRVAGHHHTLGERRPQRIGHAPRATVPGQSQDFGIIGVDDKCVGRPLVHEEPSLGRRVCLDVGMAIEMVRVQVQEDRDPRPERRGQLELKARHLDDVG